MRGDKRAICSSPVGALTTLPSTAQVSEPVTRTYSGHVYRRHHCPLRGYTHRNPPHAHFQLAAHKGQTHIQSEGSKTTLGINMLDACRRHDTGHSMTALYLHGTLVTELPASLVWNSMSALRECTGA